MIGTFKNIRVIIMFSKLVLVVAASTLTVSAAGQTYPDRPIRVIVGVPAGATPDVMARSVTVGMSKILGQALVVDNRGRCRRTDRHRGGLRNRRRTDTRSS